MVTKHELLSMELITNIGLLIKRYFNTFARNKKFFFVQDKNMKILCFGTDAKISLRELQLFGILVEDEPNKLDLKMNGELTT